jgi:phosphopantothenoylcysteine decarboxylase/phosphopantothenate--cysteine ligase
MKKILLGITGGIAAYKGVELCRRLQDAGFQVRVVMTRGATEFVTPLTFQAVSGFPVYRDIFDEAAEAAMGHIELARWADQILIAPATADFIAKLTHGMANDLLSTLCLATHAPIAIAPAMNQQMWQAVATQENIAKLRSRGVRIIGPGTGEQACGDVGPGRMLEVADIIEELQLPANHRLLGQHWLITAGPTREQVDPVRFLSNNSSGKMGYAIAKAAARMGARVTLVSGPVNLSSPAGVERISVKSASDMFDAVMAQVAEVDVFVACAAVADYRPKSYVEQKIKKNNDSLTLELVKNPDILASVAALNERPLCIGFAAETQDVAKYAVDKLKRKNVDMICANNVSDSSIGFDSDDNALSLYCKDGDVIELAKNHKLVLAANLVHAIVDKYQIP